MTNIKGVVTPTLHVADATNSILDFEDWATETHEWISLLSLESPRILGIDQIDSFLCRYAVPRSESTTTSGIVKIQWRGLMPATWVRSLFVQLWFVLNPSCLRSALTLLSSTLFTKSQRFHSNSWFCLSGYSFPTEAVDKQDGYTILQCLGKEPKDPESNERLKQEFVLWELSQTCYGEF